MSAATASGANQPQLEAAIRQTVQSVPDVAKGQTTAGFFVRTQRGLILPAWGSFEREKKLRQFYRHEHNTLVQGVFAGIANRTAATPWEIAGPNGRAVEYFQRVFRNAGLGIGWTEFIKQIVLEWLRQDRGVYIELIAPGNPRMAPVGAVTGMAVLDSVRCYATGDPRYPVVYWSRQGQPHVLHAGRIIHLVDMRDTDEDYPGVGLCALSRVIAVVQRQILMGQYIEQALDDKPPSGINIFTNIGKSNFEQALAAYFREQQADQLSPLGRAINLFSLDPSFPIGVESVSFSKPPERFDRPTWVEVDVKEIAAAVGLDKQDFWELSGGTLGSGQQSVILNEKGKGRTQGAIYAALERVFNDVLPRDCQFRFKPKDSQADLLEAQNAQAWGSFTLALGSTLNTQEQRQILADRVAAVADVITDPGGKVRRVYDDDVQDQPAVAEDNTPMANPQAAASVEPTPVPLVRKAYDTTRQEFVDLLMELFQAGKNDELSRRRFSTVMRANLRRLGQRAYEDGLRAGGVNAPLDDDDLAVVQLWLGQQSPYVSRFSAELYGRGLSDAQVAQRAEMWANKSLQAAYDAGLLSADKNGMYEWVLGRTEQHCTICLRLNGQRHRLKEYYTRDLLPKSSALECKGFLCDCKLVRTAEAARGRF